MSSPLSIQADPSLHGAAGDTAAPRSATPAQAPAAKRVPLFVNPSYHFDPTVGIEVIEFHSNAGTVTNTIPSQKQLAAYRSHQATPPGERTPGPPPRDKPGDKPGDKPAEQPAANGKTPAG